MQKQIVYLNILITSFHEKTSQKEWKVKSQTEKILQAYDLYWGYIKTATSQK